jgi:glycosyltransferase involved in cell wall biosynthesis
MDSPSPPAERDPDELLRDADRARDNRDWALAEMLYAGFLVRRPDAWGIRVQQGHCRKEQGDAAGALDLYRQAEQEAPEDADLQVQIGHALKLMDRLAEAEAAYSRAAALDPAFAIARRELIAVRRQIAIAQATQPLRAPPAPPASAWSLPAVQAPWVASAPPAAPVMPVPAAEAPASDPAGAAIAFDVTDLLDHFNTKRTPTGIQRVQSGIVGRLVADGTEGIALIANRQDRLDWAEVDQAQFRALLDLSAGGADPEEGEWLAAVQAMAIALRRARPYRFRRGAVLLNLGNAFGFPEYFRALRVAARESDIRFLPFVHDCVPLIVPEHCVAGLVRDYARWFGGFALHASAYLCNSESTRRDVDRHVAALIPGLSLPGTVVRLDADPRGETPAPARSALSEISGLRSGEPFVLFVGTIESRKNHLMVFQAWLQLLRRHGEAAVPRLVCVGKPGWHAEAALNLLKNAPELRRHVLMLPAISDATLAALYETCLFTIYNSHYEGWGLPITESLAHGKVPLIPEHSSLPEAGGPGAVYFTPGSEPDLLAKLQGLLFDAGFRAQREAAVRHGPRLRSWAELGEQVIAVAQALGEQPAPPPRLAMQPGIAYRPRSHTSPRPSAAAALAWAMREGANWHEPEPWGVWSAGGVAALRLPLPAELRDGALRLYLELRAPPARVTLSVRVLAPGRGTLRLAETELEPGQPQTLIVSLPGADGAAELSVELDSGEGTRVQSDARLLGVGLAGLMLCREDDLAARLAYLEADRFTRPIGEN